MSGALSPSRSVKSSRRFQLPHTSSSSSYYYFHYWDFSKKDLFREFIKYVIASVVSIQAGEDLTKLWRGAVPAFKGALSENAVAFCIYGNIKRIVEATRTPSSRDAPSPLEPYISRGITGLCTAFVLCPSDVLNCRSQVMRSKGITVSLSEIIAIILWTCERTIHRNVCADYVWYPFLFELLWELLFV